MSGHWRKSHTFPSTSTFRPTPRSLTGQTRVSHCDINRVDCGCLEYRLQYPFEDDSEATSWEIDKDAWKFVTVKTVSDNDEDASDQDDAASISDDELPSFLPGDGEENDYDDEDKNHQIPDDDHAKKLSDHLEKLSVNDEALVGDRPHLSLPPKESHSGPSEEKVPVADDPHPSPANESQSFPSAEETWNDLMQRPDFRSTLYISHSVLNERHATQTLQTAYPSDDILSHKTKTGNNGIAYAATEGHYELVKWLAERGSDTHN